jgi:hypothetical protein
MAQAVSRRSVTAEAEVSPCGICGGQNATGTYFSPNSSVLLCQYHSTVALHTRVSSGGWTIGQLVATVHKHSFIPST